MSIYQEVGGEPTFVALVDRFYAGVTDDPLLRPMYPEDLTNARRHLALFLMQFFGGPVTYSFERGHPRLRMRHLPFRVDQAARDAWMMHMTAALEATPMPGGARRAMLDYFSQTASFLINQGAG